MRIINFCPFLILLSGCLQTAHPRSYIISHIPEVGETAEADQSDESHLKAELP